MQDEARTRNDTKSTACPVLGYRFLKWGLGFFIFGLIFGFGVLIHYLVGSNYNVSPYFLSNITLWFGSPLSLSVTYLQLGGLAMAIVGLACVGMWKAHVVRAGDTTTSAACPTRSHSHSSLWICNVGLILLFITGYIGYFVIDAIWPGFYYVPIFAGHNLWLILQGVSLLLFLIGMIIAFVYLCTCCKRKASYNTTDRV